VDERSSETDGQQSVCNSGGAASLSLLSGAVDPDSRMKLAARRRHQLTLIRLSANGNGQGVIRAACTAIVKMQLVIARAVCINRVCGHIILGKSDFAVAG